MTTQRERLAADVAGIAAAADTAAVLAAAAHGERIAVVETEVRLMAEDVVEIKADVKTLLAGRAGQDGVTSLMSRVAPWVAVVVSIAAVLRAS